MTAKIIFRLNLSWSTEYTNNSLTYTALLKITWPRNDFQEKWMFLVCYTSKNWLTCQLLSRLEHTEFLASNRATEWNLSMNEILGKPWGEGVIRPPPLPLQRVNTKNGNDFVAMGPFQIGLSVRVCEMYVLWFHRHTYNFVHCRLNRYQMSHHKHIHHNTKLW